MCMVLRPSNGGLVSMTELLHRLNRVDRRKGTGAKVSEDDVTRAVAKLQCLGGGFRLVSLPAAEVPRTVTPPNQNFASLYCARR